jgi:hypothetical protein
MNRLRFSVPKGLFTAALATAAIVQAGAATARAGEPECFTTASVRGDWSIVATYGANVALAIGRRTVAEDGSFTGTFLLNGPTAGSPTGARTITTGTQVGVYAVDCDGTGKVTRTLTASNGVVTTQVDDFVITKARADHGHLIATAIKDAVEVPSALVPGGIFVTREQTRLADEREHQR